MTVGIQRQPLYEQVYGALRRMILSGQLRPGMPITEQQLAATLQVSRTPIREAIRRLERDGLLRIIARSRVTVRLLAYTDVVDIYQIRTPLECLAARQSAERRHPVMLKAVEAVLQQAESALATADVLGLLEANARFHDVLASATGNRWLTDAVQRIRSPILLLHIGVLGEVPREVLDDHWAIYREVAAGNAAAAEAVMAQHMLRDQERIRRYLEHE